MRYLPSAPFGVIVISASLLYKYHRVVSSTLDVEDLMANNFREFTIKESLRLHRASVIITLLSNQCTIYNM